MTLGTLGRRLADQELLALIPQAQHARIVPGGKGQFDVEADGRLVFSKHDQGRFPEHDEIVAALA